MSDYLALVMFPALIGFIIAGFPHGQSPGVKDSSSGA